MTAAIIDEHTTGPFTIAALTTTMAGDITDLIVGPADGLIMGPAGTAAAAGVAVFPAIKNEPTEFDGSIRCEHEFSGCGYAMLCGSLTHTVG